MGVPFVRPRVAELVFRLYDRPLHPELFDVLAGRTVKRDGYTLSVRLTRTGHVLGWSDGRVHLEEVTATADDGTARRRAAAGPRVRRRPGRAVRPAAGCGTR